MGEASNKKMNGDDAHKRVVELREEIVRKREVISQELDELRRRRSETMIKAKKGAKVAGAGILGIVVTGSLVNALLDLFRKDDPAAEAARLERVEGRRESITAAIISAITSMVVSEVRGYAMDYARNKLRERLDFGRKHIETRISKPSAGSNGDHRSVA